VFMVEGLGSRIKDSGFRASGSEFSVSSQGLGFEMFAFGA
jgi:hypothetical protein